MASDNGAEAPNHVLLVCLNSGSNNRQRTVAMNQSKKFQSAAFPGGADIETEYRSIEAALLESARGRWFLAEHGRRARRLDSAMLEDALGKLQSSLRQPPALLGQLQTEVSNLKSALQAARGRVTAKPNAQTDETAPAEILKSAEALHQLAWSLQAAPINAEACERIARHASEIHAHSARQSAQSKRAIDAADALDAAIARLDAVLQTIKHEAEVDAATASADDVARFNALLTPP